MLASLLRRSCSKTGFALTSPGVGTVRDAELLAQIDAAARALREHGMRLGDRVLFQGDQSASAFVWFWATVSLGAVFVPIDADSTPHQVAWACTKLTPRLAIVEAEGARPVPGERGGNVQVISSECFREFELPGPSSAPAPSAIPGEALAACLLTSGSTAEPKAVMLSHQALADSAMRVREHFGWLPGERLLNLPAPHTMSGLRNAFIAAPLCGMEWIASPRRERSDFASLLAGIDAARPHRIVAAPLMIRHMNLLGDRVNEKTFAATRAVYSTGADLNPLEVSAFHARFAIPVINYYGLTETVGLCITQKLRDWSPDDATLGWPVGCEIRLVDGELWVRQPYPSSGYFGDSASTAALFEDGWLKTGDVARIDEAGRVVVTGRLASFIKTTQTEKVSPVEVEAILEQHGSVREAAVCGLPDRAGGERIAALIVTKDGAASVELQRSLRRWVAERLGEGRTPTVIRWATALPRTDNGKIQRKLLPGYFDA